jgi:histidine triad (HIT) family protein
MDCIFCEIIAGKRSAEFVYQDASVVAFKDINPHAPVHILIVPRKHIRSINDLTEADRSILTEMIFRAQALAHTTGITQSGYKLVFNVERGGGQYVFHLHLHLVGGW